MITSGYLAQTLECLDVPLATIDLRGRQLRATRNLSKNGHGPRSAARMTETDAVNWLLAICLDHGRGATPVDIAANVNRVRALSCSGGAMWPLNFAGDLSFAEATRAGDALERLLTDIYSGRFATWAAGAPHELKIIFEESGTGVGIALSKPKRGDMTNAAVWNFEASKRKSPRLVERQITIHGAVFERIAHAIGPPPD